MSDNILTYKRRSFIFCPGNKPDMYPKALKSGADMVCVDLEDAIAPQHKDVSRANTIKLFEKNVSPREIETIIRVNELNTDEGKKDITIKHLLTHSSGSKNFSNLKYSKLICAFSMTNDRQSFVFNST